MIQNLFFRQRIFSGNLVLAGYLGRKILSLQAQAGPHYPQQKRVNPRARFAGIYEEETIIHTLRGQLILSHFPELILVQQPAAQTSSPSCKLCKPVLH
jgi:hypothetical protein